MFYFIAYHCPKFNIYEYKNKILEKVISKRFNKFLNPYCKIIFKKMSVELSRKKTMKNLEIISFEQLHIHPGQSKIINVLYEIIIKILCLF